jgi:CheY-like chemotaxis protein
MCRVLVCADRPKARTALVSCLREAGFDVRLAPVVYEALDTDRTGLPELILADLGPDCSNTIATCERRHTDFVTADIPVLILSDCDDLNHRLQFARELLESTALQVRQIADRVGYRNPGDFTRVFRRRCGLTPRGHRHRAESSG